MLFRSFEDLAAPRLAAICDPRNLDSARVMQRLGMQYRGEEVWNTQPVSVYDLSLEAWQASRLT